MQYLKNYFYLFNYYNYNMIKIEKQFIYLLLLKSFHLIHGQPVWDVSVDNCKAILIIDSFGIVSTDRVS